jgi:chemotaxis protein CheX
MTRTDVEHMMSEIWAEMLGVAPRREESEFTAAFVAWIEVSESWVGAIKLECSLELARHGAARMFGVDAADVVRDDMDEVVKELVNVIGGNFKAIVSEQSVLSLPLLAEKLERWGAQHEMLQQGFGSKAGPCRLTIYTSTLLPSAM